THLNKVQILTTKPCKYLIIGTIPLMPNSVGPSSQSGGGTPSLQVQPITPQLLTNAQGQIIATVIAVAGRSDFTGSSCVSAESAPYAPQPEPPPPGLFLLHNIVILILELQLYSFLVCFTDPQTAPSEVDGVNLEEIREFAKAFKIRRLSLGLTQTQVGQALSATEGPAYSQSAICRFEKLDITPKSAQKIKPVLERWMAEAEARHRSGMQNLTEFIGSEPSKKRKRRTSFTPQALEILNSHFEKNTHPSGQEMTEIAEKLNYDREVVRVWFCNKRQALKNTIKRLKPAELGPVAPMDPLVDNMDEHP
uniref:POU domain protein n=1 Tax=Sinocyclocheilus anshuiensis TaxID=1608454 RepID=A0A671K670_9TELE